MLKSLFLWYAWTQADHICINQKGILRKFSYSFHLTNKISSVECMTSRFSLKALNENKKILMLSQLKSHRWRLPVVQVHYEAAYEFQVIDIIYFDYFFFFFFEIIRKIFEFFLRNKFVCVTTLKKFIAFINQIRKNCFFKSDIFTYGFVFQLLISFYDVVISTPNNQTRTFVRLLYIITPIIC